MQPPQSSRIDLGDLKAQIVKKLGNDKSKRYFFYLSRFLGQKLSKVEFDKVCVRVLGRENIQLHNQLIRSILKNACVAKTPPPINVSGHAQSVLQPSNNSPCREDGPEHTGSAFPNQNQNIPLWSNGVLPVSPGRVDLSYVESFGIGQVHLVQMEKSHVFRINQLVLKMAAAKLLQRMVM